MRSAFLRNASRESTRSIADNLVIVFARTPIGGQVKTRLGLAPSAAARLQERLIRSALKIAMESECGPVELHVTRQHEFFRSLGVRLRLQRGANLGERMLHALRGGLRRYSTVILIGSDAPALRAADLRRAARWLRAGSDVVLAPAEDGGYALIAARRVSPSLFQEIAWGTGSVYRETVGRLERARLRWRALPVVWDVDRPQDLQRLRSLRFSSASRQAARR